MMEVNPGLPQVRAAAVGSVSTGAVHWIKVCVQSQPRDLVTPWKCCRALQVCWIAQRNQSFYWEYSKKRESFPFPRRIWTFLSMGCTLLICTKVIARGRGISSLGKKLRSWIQLAVVPLLTPATLPLWMAALLQGQAGTAHPPWLHSTAVPATITITALLFITLDLPVPIRCF